MSTPHESDSDPEGTAGLHSGRDPRSERRLPAGIDRREAVETGPSKHPQRKSRRGTSLVIDGVTAWNADFSRHPRAERAAERITPIVFKSVHVANARVVRTMRSPGHGLDPWRVAIICRSRRFVRGWTSTSVEVTEVRDLQTLTRTAREPARPGSTALRPAERAPSISPAPSRGPPM